MSNEYSPQPEEDLIIEDTRKQFELPSEGPHRVVVQGFKDVGIVETKNGKKDRAALILRFDEKDSKAEPILLYDYFTKSLHEKSKLSKIVRVTTGANPSYPFHLRSLIGRVVEVVVEHKKKVRLPGSPTQTSLRT
jgi:hypothetical protein